MRLALHLSAAALFLAIAVFLHGEVWRDGPSRLAPANTVDSTGSELKGPWRHTTLSDATWVAWVTGRNARTLLRAPLRLFDAEPCFPVERSLTLGEPVLTLGFLASPLSLVTGDPILAYNGGLVLSRAMMALALYALVMAWSGSFGAALAAGVFYAFHPVWTRDVTHAYIYDTGWTFLALLFAQRLFARGRWRDAFGLAASVALQMGTSLYPMVAAFFIGPPFALWLAWHYRLRHVRPVQLLAVLGLVLVAAALVYGPFVGALGSPEALRRGLQMHALWASFLPGGLHFEGWLVLALAVAGLLLAGAGALPGLRADPRAAALAAGFLVAIAATGPHQPALVPNLYGWLASLLPGLDAVRAPARVAAGVHAVACLLAGLGAATLLRLAPAGAPRAAAAGLLVVAAALVTLRPGWIGLEPRPRYEAVVVRPAPARLDFFRELERRGDAGPLLELPLRGMVPVSLQALSQRIMATAWHRRRTSACYGSLAPPGRERLLELAAALPEREAVVELHALGFRTLVLHGKSRFAALHERIDTAAAAQDAPLRSLHRDEARSAWALTP